MTISENFTIRVYGVVISKSLEVLLTDEFRFGRRMTKFPGGGLRFGEGTIDCLKREFVEELGQEPFNIRHLYTTDFFQPTALVTPQKQLISIYYTVDIPSPDKIEVAVKPFDFSEVEGAQVFRWVPVNGLSPDDVTFPIDKKVVGLLNV